MAHQIEFYNPDNLTVPIDLIVKVDNVMVEYKPIKNGFKFIVITESEEEALAIVKILIDRIKNEHCDSTYGVEWQTKSLKRELSCYDLPCMKTFEWEYRLCDS